ncbi:MAG TPA: PLP-dependent aminotransferase family protein [Acidobacteriota bacterium]|nr:PLP-dependent aminotransferase family protein [Acidobacteriota bacterium]
MTIWKPDLGSRSGPRYLAIADALQADIEEGRLKAGARLPTHRQLADALEVTVGTVTRAYAEAEKRGLTKGEVGRGTFVRPSPESLPVGSFGTLRDEDDAKGTADGPFELSLSVPHLPSCPEEGRALHEAFSALASDGQLSRLLESQPYAGAASHRRAGSRWFEEIGVPCEPSQVLICCGAQHAISVVLSSLCRPGDRILCEQLVYPGLRAAASLLGLRLRGVAVDREGLVPEALEEACGEDDFRVLYCTPTMQNPTGGILSEGRRRRIAEIVQSRSLMLIEDEVFHFLPDSPPRPISSRVPENSCLLLSTSKLVAPGLRVGFLRAPQQEVGAMASAIWATAWMAPPPMAELISRWIVKDELSLFAGWKRRQAQDRNRLAQQVLGDWLPQGTSPGMHLWLPLPEPWRAEQFAGQALARGVRVSSSEVFVAGRAAAPHAVRLSLCAESSRERMEEALQILRRLLQEGPQAAPGVI